MINKKFTRLLSLVLSTALFICAIPNTVTAAELYDENDTYVINDDLEKNPMNENTETTTETEINQSLESISESISESATESILETEVTVSTENESETESEPEINTEPESEEDINSEMESDTTLESDAETEIESESALESETEVETKHDIQTAIDAFHALTAKMPFMALLYRTDSYNVRQEPSEDSDSIATIESGHTLYITSVEIFDDNIWYQVQFGLNGAEYTGYVESYYLAYSDENWLNWESEYLTNIFGKYDTSVISSYALNSKVDTSDIEAFPYFYQDKLIALKELHPNWTFVPMNTGLDFKTVVANEMGEKNLIQNTTSNAEKGWVGKLNGAGWYYATEDAVSYYMKTCNFLTEGYIFQFEQLTFNGSYHTVSAIQNFLNNTFMKGKLPDDSSKSYAQAFYEIGKNRSLSPIHLAARVFQEQGNGKSALSSGTYKGYEG